MKSLSSTFQNILALRRPESGELFWESFVPDFVRHDEEKLRRCRLHIRFGWLGSIFGSLYALFYLLIGHWWGAQIIVLCSMLVTLGPWLVRQRGDLRYTGHFYTGTLLMGFSALCLVEGGLEGHAIAWLASIPLCALMLLEIRAALGWAAVCFLVALAIGLADLAGYHCARTYPPQWHTLISVTGYAGLVAFMTLLGASFESTRARAFGQMEQAVSKLHQANHRLSKLIEEKDEFMKIAAHDLNNPLCGVVCYSELLMMFGDKQTKEEIIERAQGIHSLSQRMLDIIRNFLEVRRLEEEGSSRLQPARASAESLLQGILKDQARSAERKHIRLSFEPAAAPAYVFADVGAVQQILDNLLSNAIKYSPMHTTVHCRFHEEADGVRIDIRDEGPGLSEADQQKLFQKFAKLTPRPTAGEGSNGLGLWIVQRMAQSMNGDVRCHSIQGQGCTFSLRLPKWTPEVASLSGGGMAALPLPAGA